MSNLTSSSKNGRVVQVINDWVLPSHPGIRPTLNFQYQGCEIQLKVVKILIANPITLYTHVI